MLIIRNKILKILEENTKKETSERTQKTFIKK